MESPLYRRPKELAEMFGIGRSTIYRYAKEDPNFPKPLKPTAKTTLFNVKEVEEYFKKKTAEVNNEH